MTEITNSLYKAYDLPVPSQGQLLPADHNELTKKMDGKTDVNRDGVIDETDRNGWVEPQELYAYDLHAQQVSLKKLENPYEVTEEMGQYVDSLFALYDSYINENKEQIELRKALVLYTAIFPSTENFYYNGRYIHGFEATEEQKGLEVAYDHSDDHPLRLEHGALRPKEIFSAPQWHRVANCIEYAFLLTALLRYAGIEAAVKTGEDVGNIYGITHTYVIARLDGVKYRLDLSGKAISKNPAALADTDRVGIAVHYQSEGIRYRWQKKYDLAEKALRQSLELEPNDSNTWSALGAVYADEGQLAEAKNVMKYAIFLDENDAAAWNNLGHIYEQEGDLPKAIECAETSIAIRPHFATAWAKKTHYLLSLNELPAAIDSSLQLLKLDPQDHEGWNNLGVAYLRSGKLEPAWECFREAIDLKEDHVSAWDNLRIVYERVGDQEQAKRCREKVRELNSR
ncbi:tetratricopeptide repeat protein [Candidatus Margulisiibacteriota bacterium]